MLQVGPRVWVEGRWPRTHIRTHPQPAWEIYSRALSQTRHVLRAYVEGAPEGVKLNMPLTAALGKLLLTVRTPRSMDWARANRVSPLV